MRTVIIRIGSKIEEFLATANDKKKNKKKIVSLIKLNEARKKMRSSLGMDLKVSPEKAIESYEKAQEIYPSMKSPKIMIKQIKELIKQQLI